MLSQSRRLTSTKEVSIPAEGTTAIINLLEDDPALIECLLDSMYGIKDFNYDSLVSATASKHNFERDEALLYVHAELYTLADYYDVPAVLYNSIVTSRSLIASWQYPFSGQQATRKAKDSSQLLVSSWICPSQTKYFAAYRWRRLQDGCSQTAPPGSPRCRSRQPSAAPSSTRRTSSSSQRRRSAPRGCSQ